MSAEVDVRALLPHRDPFLFVDRVVEHSLGELVSEWTVPPDADWFRGHYPGQPVTPGVLIAEHAFQSGALRVALELGDLSELDGVPVLTRIRSARYRRMVAPGETLRTRITTREHVGPAFELDARVTYEGARVAELTFVLTTTGALARAGTP